MRVTILMTNINYLFYPLNSFFLCGRYENRAKENFKYSEQHTKWDKNIQKYEKLVYCDAQTSGGLLISINKEKSNLLLNQLHLAGIKDSAIIGEVTENQNTKLIIK